MRAGELRQLNRDKLLCSYILNNSRHPMFWTVRRVAVDLFRRIMRNPILDVGGIFNTGEQCIEVVDQKS